MSNHALEPSELFSELGSTPSAPDSTNSEPTNNGIDYTTELEQLRKKVKAQKKQIQSLYDELDKEREASTSGANAAVEMISRLSCEKGTVQWEVRNLMHVAEVTAHHKKASDDIKDSKIADLEAQIEAYREHMKLHGIEPDGKSEYESGHGSATNSEPTNNGVDYTTELEQLREKVKAQEKQIQSLSDKFDKVSEAATSVANTAMAMINRLNNEKTALQLEALNMMLDAELAVHHKKESDNIKDSKIADLEAQMEAYQAQMEAYRKHMKRHGIKPDGESEYESEHGSATNYDPTNNGIDYTTELEQLREKVKAQEKQIQFLYDKFDKESEAATSAANAAMATISRPNYEKAAVQHEARNMMCDAELAVHHKEESNYIKDGKIADLAAQTEAYREHMKRHGIEPDESAIVKRDNSNVDVTKPKSNAQKFSVFGIFKEWLSNLFFQRGQPRSMFGLNITSIGFLLLLELSSSLSQSRSFPGKRR